MIITLEDERPQSWNQMYSGVHWAVRKAEADRVHQLVYYSIYNQSSTMSESPVDITVTAYFKNRPLDSDNICAKLYIDALKGILIHDDTPEFVRSVRTVSLVDKARPRLEIEVVEI